MANIETLKERQLLGGNPQDDATVYPISTTQAIYSHYVDGSGEMQVRQKDGVPEKLEDRLEDHENDAIELHSKTELFSVELIASPSNTTRELQDTRTPIILTPKTSIKTYGDYGERDTTSDSSNLTVTNTDEIHFESATLTDNGDGTYSWEPANRIGTQTATFTATKNGHTRVVTRTVSLYLRKYFAFMSEAPANVEAMINQGYGHFTSEYSTSVTTGNVTIPINENGPKHVYIAMPSNMSLTGHNIVEAATQLEFKVTEVGNINRTINGKSFSYILYESIATPESSNPKVVYIK